MAYHGYIPVIHNYLQNFQQPQILEIGVDSGITAFSLAQRLTRTHEKFFYDGVDIKIRTNVVETFNYFGLSEGQKITLFEENSLVHLENTQKKYDVILIDGDHNYFTVEKELQHLEKISHDDTLVICDDYHGRWSDKDLFYSQRPEYSDNKNATIFVETEKKGVKIAIDEFLSNNSQWVQVFIMEGEPIAFMRKNKVKNDK
jgi:predicted O-methyltransferase YrrM